MTTAVDPAPTRPGSGGPTARALSSHAARVAAAVVASLALVVVAVWAPLAARLTGEEITLRVAPVDPLDPFRGAYVDLSYPDLPTSETGVVEQTEAELEARDAERGTAYVPLTRQGEVWVGGAVQRTAPADGLYLTCDDSSWRLECGIESLFLPQDEALALEEAVREGTAVATVKVDAAGHAALLGVSAP
jgi:uncharacterized membrane-anchored protein